jgi:hypothetical protein
MISEITLAGPAFIESTGVQSLFEPLAPGTQDEAVGGHLMIISVRATELDSNVCEFVTVEQSL